MILIPVSGGLDSVAALWHYRDEDIWAFHLPLGACNPLSQRREAEVEASRATVGYVREHGSGSVSWTELGLSETDPLHAYLDLYPVNLYIGALLQAHPEIDRVCRVAVLEDITERYLERRARCYEIVDAMAGRDFQWESPFVDTPKIRLYEGLPQFLRDVFVSCVEPSRGTDRWMPCLACFKCDELRGAGIPGYSSSEED